MITTIYAIYDKLAQNILGGVHLHAHAASAVRMFSDVAQMEGSMIGRHPQDYYLARLGRLETETGEITPDHEVILEGSTWAAAQTPPAQG